MRIIKSDLFFEEKIHRLKLKPITKEIYDEHLKLFEGRSIDTSRFTFYKRVSKNEVMLYSTEYILSTPYKELKQKQRHRLISRIKLKIEAKLLRLDLYLRKMINNI